MEYAAYLFIVGFCATGIIYHIIAAINTRADGVLKNNQDIYIANEKVLRKDMENYRDKYKNLRSDFRELEAICQIYKIKYGRLDADKNESEAQGGEG
jgi:hypothetical protein